MSIRLQLSGASCSLSMDCGDPDVAATSLAEFDRALEAGQDEPLAAWARRWGRNLLNQALEPKWDLDE